MNTEASTLPVLDVLHMEVPLSGVHISRTPEPCYHVIFRICMHNASDISVRLKGRKWLLRDSSGQSRIIEAEHVFNQCPVLAPGAVYSYSGCQSFTMPPVNMEVRFFGEDQRGIPFISPALIFPRHMLRIQHA